MPRGEAQAPAGPPARRRLPRTRLCESGLQGDRVQTPRVSTAGKRHDLEAALHRPRRLAAAVRWEWISSNPAEVARKPRQPTPQPKPLSPVQAGMIVTAALGTGRRPGNSRLAGHGDGSPQGRATGLRWSDVDLEAAYLTISRNYLRINRRKVEKDTKTHQMRRISLDPRNGRSPDRAPTGTYEGGWPAWRHYARLLAVLVRLTCASRR
jgi:hypothetical protein